MSVTSHAHGALFPCRPLQQSGDSGAQCCLILANIFGRSAVTNIYWGPRDIVTRPNHHPNVRLIALMSEAEVTGQKLAKVINEAGGEVGLTLRYDRRSVDHWRRGHQPRSPVPQLAAEAFSRLLGRQVTVPETGLTGEDHGTSGSGTATPAEELVRLREFADNGGRRTAVPPVYEVAALTVPG